MVICHLFVFLGDMTVKVFVPFLTLFLFVFLLLNFICTLYILVKSDLSDVPFANIFSQSVACLIILLVLSFTEHMFLIQIKPFLSIGLPQVAQRDFPVAQMVRNPPAVWETWVQSLGSKDLLE